MGGQTVSKLVVSSKSESFRKLIAQGTVLLHLDPRIPGVIAPVEYLKQHTLVLMFGYSLPIPTNDVVTDYEVLTATLSFDHTPFKVSIPWTAVFAVTDNEGQGFLWPEDAPKETLARIQDANDPPADRSNERTPFRVLDGGLKDPPGNKGTRKNQ